LALALPGHFSLLTAQSSMHGQVVVLAMGDVRVWLADYPAHKRLPTENELNKAVDCLMN